MDRRRIVFYAALTLFATWVATLGVMAVTSSEKPQAKMSTGGDILPPAQ